MSYNTDPEPEQQEYVCEVGYELCPYCNGQSVPRHLYDDQLAQTGDPSGGCSTCNNNQVIRVSKLVE